MSNRHQNPTASFAVVVNDDPTQLNVLSGLVSKAGLETRSFTGAQAALADMLALAGLADGADVALPALIITDLYMPGIDGWRFCRLLRSPEYAAFNKLPVLVVSATFAGDEPDRIAADLGAQAFIPSPVDGKQFVEQVQAILSGTQVRSPLRALIVDDSKTLADTLKKAFSANGYQADMARTILAASAAFKKTDYDVAVLDYHLPDGTGDALLDAFRMQRPDCVCLMMTSDPRPELALDWMKRGAAAYLRKPFEPDYLIELCARSRRERALLRTQSLLELRTRDLRKSEKLLNTTQLLSKVGGWEWDVQTQTMQWTDETYRIHDMPPGERILGSPEQVEKIAACYPSDVRATVLDAFRRCVEHGESYDIEAPFTSTQGRSMWVRTTAEAVWDGNRIVKVVGNITDITEVKMARLFRDRQLGFSKALNEIADVIFTNDNPVDILESSNRIVGETLKIDRTLIYDVSFERNNIIGLCEWLNMDHPEVTSTTGEYSLDLFINPFTEIWNTKRFLESHYDSVTDPFLEDGSGRILHEYFHIKSLIWYPFAFYERGFYVFTINQILQPRTWTQDELEFLDSVSKQVSLALMKIELLEGRKRTEETLRDSEANLREAQKIARIGRWEMDLATNHLVWSEGLYTLFEVDQDAFGASYEAFFQFVHPDDRTLVEQAYREAVENRTAYQVEHRLLMKDGRIKWVSEIGRTEYDETGRAVRSVGIAQDITERKQVEEVQAFLAQASSGTADEPFLRALAQYLARSLAMDFVSIARLEGDGVTARTVAVWCDGHFEDNISYALKDTPCGDVVAKGVYCFPANVCQYFPQDQVLQDLRAESYVGVKLWSHTGEQNGLIAVIGRSPLANRSLAKATLGMVAIRAAGELERLDAEMALRESEARLRLALAGGELGTWDWLIPSGATTFDARWAAMLGYALDEIEPNTWAWEALVHPDDLPQVMKDLHAHLEGRTDAYESEHRMRHRSGEWIWVLTKGRVIERDPDGKPLRVCGTHLDISQRKRTEIELKKSESHLNEAQWTARIGWFVTDVATGVWEGSPTLYDIFGIDSSFERNIENWGKLMVPGTEQEMVDYYYRIVREKGRFEKDYRIIRPNDGQMRWLSVQAQFEFDAEGNPITQKGTIQDVTERKLAEEALRESEARVQKKLQSILSPDDDIGPLELADLIDVGAIQLLMEQFYKLTRVPNSIIDLKGNVLVGTGWQDICTQFHRVHPDTCRNCIECDTLLTKDIPPGTFSTYLCKNNLWDCATPLIVGGKQVGNLFTGQFFFEGERPDDSVFRAQAAKYGFDEEKYMEALSRVPVWDRETINVAFEFYSSLAVMITSLSHRNIALARILEERKRVEEALRESERTLNEAQQTARIGSFFTDLSTGHWDGTPTLYEILGIDLSYVRDVETWGKLMTPECEQETVDYFYRVIQEKAKFDKDYQIIRPSDGERRWMEGRGEVACDDDGNPVTMKGTIQDITERKQAEVEKARLEAQLQQSQRMESVGRLAGGVAHDFNNMLGVILGHSELALAAMEPGHPLLADLVEIQAAAQRSADLTRQLLAFARKQTVAPKVLDLNETVAGMLKMLQRLIGENIDLDWRPGADLWAVNVDPSQIDQILANLCVNARDAIADVGKLTLSTENSIFDEEYCSNHAGFVPGDYVRIAVSDSGCGMDEEILPHIFEPFFTTKGVGEGTGLGLATVYGAVKQNGGFINAYSEPGHGTTFTIYLPRHMGKAEQMQEIGAAEPNARGHETVLIVEDEPAILKLTTRLLKKLGYTVLAAPTPDEAIRLAETFSGDIHLVITDVVMPGMNGRDLANRLLAIYPYIKRLFMSGYTADIIAHRGVLDEGVYFIQKPFSTQSLAAKIREVLDSE